MNYHYLYLHGFCSGPLSAKAKYFQQRFNSLGLPLTLPDLNEPNFTTLTLTRQIEQVQALLVPREPVTLIGSSFGGLTAVLLAEQFPQIDRLILLAPAFNFLDYWLPQLSPEDLDRWQTTGYRSLYHYGEQQERSLHYQFITDALQPQYRVETLKRSLPTLILHGRADEVIPLAASEEYGANRPWVRLMPLESDHSLANVISTLWQETRRFLSL
ncbi:MAG: YqiA/YcfP family alpha/beta fold hydrolase [Prochlorotrichaceae cyanobacterium]